MTYKLNPEVRKITSPVTLVIGGETRNYPNGEALTELTFDKRYRITSLSAQGGEVVLNLEENKQVNDTAWNNDKKVSFFD